VQPSVTVSIRDAFFCCRQSSRGPDSGGLAVVCPDICRAFKLFAFLRPA
jgi:hypothetical protein